MGQSQTKQVKQTTQKDGKIRFALAGECGTGKSAFINAIRGLKDDENDAAEVDVMETAEEPTEYTYPGMPMITLVELPGIGTPNYPDLRTYCEKVDLEKYDTFLIFTADRFTQNDLALAKKVKSLGKSFFLIHTKIDNVLRPWRPRAPIDEEATLQKIRKYCMDNVKGLISSEKEIFLISNYDKEKWDFDRLVKALPGLEREVFTRGCLKRKAMFLKEEIEETKSEESEKGKETEREETERGETEDTEETTDLTEEYLADARAYINKNGISGIGEFLRKKLDEWKNVKIRFGITGDSGTGKSTFINAIRGLKDDEKHAAKVDFIEATRQPKEYTYPGNPMIILVDLPGIGTPNYPNLPTYCEKVGLEKYDTFLIFTGGRFTQHDLELAKKVKDIGKSFFLIRTKIDNDLRPLPGKTTLDEETTLRRIRKKCMDQVKDLISSEKEIFIIGNYNKEEWDFDRLVKAIGKALPILQREVLIRSVSNLTRGCLMRKAMFLKVRAVAVATISAGNGANPFSGGAVFDAELIRDTVKDYHRQLDLHDVTSDTFEQFNKYEKVLQRYKFQSDEELLLSLNSEAHGLRKVQEVSKYIPILGTAIAGSISFALMLRYLVRCVDELEEVAIVYMCGTTQRNDQSTNNSHIYML